MYTVRVAVFARRVRLSWDLLSGEEVIPMGASTFITAVASLLLALAAIGGVVFRFWREKRRSKKKRKP